MDSSREQELPVSPDADRLAAEVGLRATERKRLRALVAADMAIADRLHADDFQLINPGGGVLTKTQYLDGIASGYLNYRLWEPDSAIDVRLYGRGAVIRYRSRLHMCLGGAEGELRQYWHTDLYELRDERWQVVWSQATAIA
jgi:hypothetical protein